MLGGGGGKDEAHLVRWEFFYLHSCSSFLIRLINHIFVFFNSFFFFIYKSQHFLYVFPINFQR